MVSAPSMRREMTRFGLAPLRHAVFRRLCVAWWVNEVGNWLGDVALAIVVYDRTGSTLAVAALLVAARLLPAFVGPLLALRLGTARLRRHLPALHALQALLFAVLAIGAVVLPWSALVVIAAVDGALAVAARALTRAAIAETLAPIGLLREGNALINLGFTAAGALGPALAGVIAALAGPRAALAGDAVSFLLVALVLLGLPASTSALAGAADRGLRGRLRAGRSALAAHPDVRVLLGAQAIALVFFTMVPPLEVAFAKTTLSAGDGGFGALLAAWGAGMLLGGTLFATLTRRSLQSLLFVSTLAISAGYAGMALSPGLVAACAAAALGGLGNGVQWVAVVTLVQERIAPEGQAATAALLELIASVMPAAGFVLGGVVATVLSPRAGLAIASAGVLLVAAGTAVRLRGRSSVPAALPEPASAG